MTNKNCRLMLLNHEGPSYSLKIIAINHNLTD